MEHGAFADRMDAATKLADTVAKSVVVSPDSLVLGLVRGGAMIASRLAQCLSLAWDVYVVRKIGAPAQPEYAVGAICEQGTYVFNHKALDYFELGSAWQTTAIASAWESCKELQKNLRNGQPLIELAGLDVVICDDGMATGLSMQVAIEGVRSQGARSIGVAVPVLSSEALGMLKSVDVQPYYLGCPDDFRAVGNYYEDFSPVQTSEVARLLAARTARL